MKTLLIAACAASGALAVGVAGWLDSHEPFDKRKFGKSIITAGITGILFALGYSFTDGIGVRDGFVAFIGGAGIDAFRDRIEGTINKPKPPA